MKRYSLATRMEHVEEEPIESFSRQGRKTDTDLSS